MRGALARAGSGTLVLAVRARLIIGKLTVATTLALFTTAFAAAFLLPAWTLRLMLVGLARLRRRSLWARFACLGLARWTIRPALIDAAAAGNTPKALVPAFFRSGLRWRGMIVIWPGRLLPFANRFRAGWRGADRGGGGIWPVLDRRCRRDLGRSRCGFFRGLFRWGLCGWSRCGDLAFDRLPHGLFRGFLCGFLRDGWFSLGWLKVSRLGCNLLDRFLCGLFCNSFRSGVGGAR